MMTGGFDAVERVARESYGRVVAVVASRTGDVAAAEDAVSAALVAALETWRHDGVPANPVGWLVRVARNRAIDEHRQRSRLRELPAEVQAVLLELDVDDGDAIPDDRLAMLIACASPAVEAAVRGPLMLQAVMGLDAGRIASAYVVSRAAMAQRLVRAKARLSDMPGVFAAPDRSEVARRIPDVLEAVYAAFTIAAGSPDADGAPAMVAAALGLGRSLGRLCPDEPECAGLLALMLHRAARLSAQTGPDGAFVPLREQSASAWDSALIAEADEALLAATTARRPGRFQIEAAIHSAHAHGAAHGEEDHEVIGGLYEMLLRVAPSLGASVAAAGACLEAGRAAEALRRLDALPVKLVADYQPFWSVRAHVLLELGRIGEAAEAFRRAAGLCDDGPSRRYLLGRAGECAVEGL